MSSAESDADRASPLKAALSLFDATSIIVSIVIGSAIYEKAPFIAAQATGWIIATRQWLAGGVESAATGEAPSRGLALAAVIGVWLLGGVVAWVGALCYAELATAYPHAGGTYVYLSRAFGRYVGFAFVWTEFWIVRPGNVGAIAFVFARYAGRLLGLQSSPVVEVSLAGGAILVLAVVNAIGLNAGKWTQNVLMACKVVGLVAIFLTGMFFAAPAEVRAAPLATSGSVSLAMIFIMFAYGGWADMSYVAAEVRDPARNISRALALGTLIISAIYMLVNLAFANSLGIGGMARSEAVAADVLSLAFGDYGSRAISLLICISCLGAVQGMIFTGARVYYALGREQPLFRWLGQWNEARGVPGRSLWIQTLVTVGMVAAFGLYSDGKETGFDRLVIFSAPFFWGFIGLVGVALIVLRNHDGAAGRLYRVPLYPLTPIVLTLSSAAMVYAAVDYAAGNPAWEAAWAGIVVASGIVLLPWVGGRPQNLPANT